VPSKFNFPGRLEIASDGGTEDKHGRKRTTPLHDCHTSSQLEPRGVGVESAWGRRGVGVGSAWGRRGVGVESAWSQLWAKGTPVIRGHRYSSCQDTGIGLLY
jgi:hypothetical protein